MASIENISQKVKKSLWLTDNDKSNMLKSWAMRWLFPSINTERQIDCSYYETPAGSENKLSKISLSNYSPNKVLLRAANQACQLKFDL